MAIVAHAYPFVVGVDTHAREHVFAVLSASGEVIATGSFPTTEAGMGRALGWVRGRAGQVVLMVVEGVATYGAGLARAATEAGFEVVEAARMNARANRVLGKDDVLDATRIAAAVLPLEISRLRRPRADAGQRAALRVLLTARDHMTRERTRCVNALTALVRSHPLGVDARRKLTAAQITALAASAPAPGDPIEVAIARGEAVRLANRVIGLGKELAVNRATITKLVRQTQAADLLALPGFGPYTCAVVFTAWSHPGRVRSEAAFAALAGVNPIPASSGNTTRHRLNRGGDRALNKAAHIVAGVRMRDDETTRAYVKRRRGEGLSDNEIRRCLKRYIIRNAYRLLNTAAQPAPAT